VQGEVGKDVKLPVREDGTLGDDGVRVVGDVNAVRVEMGAVRGARGRVVKEKNRDKTNRRLRNEENISKDEALSMGAQGHIAYADGIDGQPPQTFDRVRGN